MQTRAWTFSVATVAFLVIGLLSIKDIHSVLTSELESLKEDAEEEKRTKPYV